MLNATLLSPFRRHKKKPANSLLPYYFAIILTYIIWSAAGPVIKLTVEYIPVFTFLLFRFIIVCTILLPYVYVELKKNPIHKDDILKIIVLGIFSQASLALIFFGFKYTSAIEATVIGLLAPILSVYAGHYFYNEKVDTHVRTGLGIATLGTIFVALEPILSTQHITQSSSLRLFGNFLVVIYTLAFLMYILWSKMTMGNNSKPMKKTLRYFHMKPMKRHYSAALLTALTFYVGLATYIPLGILENNGVFGTQIFTPEQFTIVPIAGVLYMALISSIVAYTAFEWGLSKVEVKDTAIFSYLQPVFTLPFAYILLRELPNQYTIVGGAIIALGVLIAESKKS